MDAHDSPPVACGVVLERDCEGEGDGKGEDEGKEVGLGRCVIGGIMNYVSCLLFFSSEILSGRII